MIRNQQVSGSSPLAGSNLALIKWAASDPVLMVALSDPTVCANYVRIFSGVATSNVLTAGGQEVQCGTRRAVQRGRGYGSRW